MSQGETKFTTVHVVVRSTFISNPSCTLYFQSVMPLLVKYTRLQSAGHLKWVAKCMVKGKGYVRVWAGARKCFIVFFVFVFSSIVTAPQVE